MASFFKGLWTLRARKSMARRTRRPDFAVPALEQFEQRLAPSANYYLSPSGDDHANGQSPATAWRTLSRVNAQSFGPGDKILLQGGATFTGSLQLLSGGTPNNPLRVRSYGQGRATIASGLDNGILAYNTSGLDIKDLNLVGAGLGAGTNTGIVTYIGGIAAAHVHIEDAAISGYAYGGVTVYVDAGSSLSDVRIARVTVHDCGLAVGAGATGGIFVSSDVPSARRIFGLVIDHVQVFRNTQQFGIYLSNVTGAVVEKSEVHDITGAGSIGVTAWDSDNVAFQGNECYRIIDPTLVDGDGFFFGNGVNDSVMEYNYSHDNDSFGFGLVADLPGRASSSRDTIRYNISENDARSGPNSPSLIVADNVWDSDIYNNTFFRTPNYWGGRQAIFLLYNWNGYGLRLWNNILAGSDINFFSTNLSTAAAASRGLVFQGNDYFSTTGSFQIYYPDRTFFSLSDWQNATGEEMLGNTPVGSTSDPQLVNLGGGGTVGHARRLASLDAYMLQSTSPVGTAGLDLAGLFGIDPGSHDFYGQPLPQGSGVSVGAYQMPIAAGPQTGDPLGLTDPSPVPPGVDGSPQQAGTIRPSLDLAQLALALAPKRTQPGEAGTLVTDGDLVGASGVNPL